MNPSSIDTLKNNFFEIQNVNSSFNQYYHLTSPYNAVIETYRSDLDQPYFKISSFSLSTFFSLVVFFLFLVLCP